MGKSKIKFGTDGWRAVIGADFTVENLLRVSQATSDWLLTLDKTPSLILGYDCRFNGKLFAEKAAALFAQNGIQVFLSPSFVSTPMVSLATAQRQSTAGVVITASHNPPEYSGFKVKGSFGGPAFPAMIADIEARIQDQAPEMSLSFEEALAEGKIEYYDMEALYMNHIRGTFDLDSFEKAGIKLGYDAMYGAGQRVFARLFPKAHLLNCEFNPSFKGQAPEPIEKNLKPFQKLVLDRKLDWGLATDGDADRIGLFDVNGKFVDSHHILLLLIHYLAGFKKLKGKVVTTFTTTSRISALCQHCGLEHQVTPVGFKYIGEIMCNEDVLVGGEESGGIAVWGHVPERDGIYIGLMILEMMVVCSKSIPELIEDVYALSGRFAMYREDLHLTEEKKSEVIHNCKTAPAQNIDGKEVVKVEDLDGWKFHFDAHSWVMIRPSGTEPVLRVYSEAQNEEAAKILVQSARKHWKI